jgi:hypothetical protein
VINLRWIHYWYDNAAGDNFRKTVLKMMMDMFYDKIAGDLQLPPAPEETTDQIITPAGEENFLLLTMLQRQKNAQGIRTNDNNDVKRRVEQILEEEIETYFKYISSIDYVELIKSYPSNLYDEKTFNEDQVLKVKDPIYAARNFDVFGWWRHYGRNKFKYLELCALIVLAKPVHNGFQERVFSRGTFTDDQLRRKMKETTFEISILEAINCKTVDKYMDMYKLKATKEKIADTVNFFWSGNKYLEESSKPNLSDDDSSDEEEYDVEIDDELDSNSEDEYMSD